MQIYVLFGLPGAGKTFIGNVLKKYFDFYFYDGDQDMHQELRDALGNQKKVTDEMRSKFFNKLIDSVKQLKLRHKKIVISQTFIKEKFREQFLNEIPETKFILVQVATNIREKRLINRKGFQLDIKYWRKMYAIFESPVIEHTVIYNDREGDESIREQFQILLK